MEKALSQGRLFVQEVGVHLAYFLLATAVLAFFFGRPWLLVCGGVAAGFMLLVLVPSERVADQMKLRRMTEDRDRHAREWSAVNEKVKEYMAFCAEFRDLESVTKHLDFLGNDYRDYLHKAEVCLRKVGDRRVDSVDGLTEAGNLILSCGSAAFVAERRLRLAHGLARRFDFDVPDAELFLKKP